MARLGYFGFWLAQTPPASRWFFMILVAIFSIIVLLLCFLCYSGDCNN